MSYLSDLSDNECQVNLNLSTKNNKSHGDFMFMFVHKFQVSDFIKKN